MYEYIFLLLYFLFVFISDLKFIAFNLYSSRLQYVANERTQAATDNLVKKCLFKIERRPNIICLEKRK